MKTKRFLQVGSYIEEISEELYIKLRDHQNKWLPLRGLMTLEIENFNRYPKFTLEDFKTIKRIFHKGDRRYPFIFSEPSLKIHQKISNK